MGWTITGTVAALVALILVFPMASSFIRVNPIIVVFIVLGILALRMRK